MADMTLTDFLLARIAEDEAVARAAEPGRWKLWGMAVLADAAGTGNAEDCVEVAGARTPSTAGRMIHTGNARHIARHDPGRVLARCDADRLIVEQHSESAHVCPSGDLWTDDERWLGCRTLAALAAIYADHPDHRPEWRP